MTTTTEERLERAAAELDFLLPGLQPRPLASLRRRGHRRHVAAATCGFVLGIASVGAVISARDHTTPRPIKPAAGSQSGPTPTSMAPIRPTVMTASSRKWKSAVVSALADAGSDLRIDRVVVNDVPPFGVSAISDLAPGRVVFGLQTFAQGEYRTDASWQMEMAGSTKPGISVPEGTLFAVDEPGSAVRAVTIVGPEGIVSVQAESVPTLDLPSDAVLRSLVRSLARSASAIATTP